MNIGENLFSLRSHVDQIRVAILRDWDKKRFVYGGSTLTQQLARTLYLSPRKNLFRKAKEAVLTIVLEHDLPKRRILENRPQASPADIEEYERLLAERFTQDPDLAQSPAGAQAVAKREKRLEQLYKKLFGGGECP